MNSFDMQVHIEELAGTYEAQVWLQRIEEVERIFKSSIKSLLMYRRVASDNQFHSAAYETFENASMEMRDFLVLNDIDTFGKFLIYLNGIMMGVSM